MDPEGLGKIWKDLEGTWNDSGVIRRDSECDRKEPNGKLVKLAKFQEEVSELTFLSERFGRTWNDSERLGTTQNDLERLRRTQKVSGDSGRLCI